MLDIRSEIKLRIQKGDTVCWNAPSSMRPGTSNGTCVSMLTNSKDRGSAELANGKWWGPVAEIGSSMRFL